MEILIIILLLAIAAETTYLTVTHAQKMRRTAQAPIFVDTSVLIDGRIMAIAESGFLSRTLYIPRSVVGELQFLADNADTDKRTRARHGLDIINELQKLTTVDVEIFPDGTRAKDGVDNRLLELAKKHKGSICTIDYNLNKVAVVEGIPVLNVNDLAKTLRMAYLPGERLTIELTQKGNDSHQAVGHLPDGTMVVVENAYQLLGKPAEVEFIRSLQTAAGKMMFAKLVGSEKNTKAQAKASAKPMGKKPVKSAAQVPEVQEATDTQPQPHKERQQAPRRSQQQTQQQNSVSQPQNDNRNRQRNNRRRSSPEDSMVELANQ